MTWKGIPGALGHSIKRPDATRTSEEKLLETEVTADKCGSGLE